MNSKLESTMARGRAAGVTQCRAREIGRDGRTLRLEPDGREVLSFATCSYLGLDRDPRLGLAAIAAIDRFGVSFSASRCFVTSPLYGEAEDLLAEVFGRPVVLTGSTTLAHGAALPILLSSRDVVLYDRQVHHSVQTALAALGPRGPLRQVVEHANLEVLEAAIVSAIASGAQRVWYCADGIYSMFGDRLFTGGLATLMQRYEQLHSYLDDAHGMSWCGTRGAGSLIDAALPIERTVLVTSLSKGFGCSGGLIAVPDLLTKQRIENLGPSLMFSIQLPPAALGAICASARIHLDTQELVGMQQRVDERMLQTRARVRADPTLAARAPAVVGEPTPIQYIVLGTADTAIQVTATLLARGFLVNPVAFPAVPLKQGGVRFTLTRAHTAADVDALLATLSQIIREQVEV